jgi:CubicO group peptidase (beta-lactamase class C family)
MKAWIARTALYTGLALIASGIISTTGGQSAREKALAANPQVDKIFAPWDKPDSPGCALAVSKAGNIVYKRGYGMADLEHKIPITPRTVFHAASLAKQFTAMSIMLLVGQHKLSLDDDARNYITELPNLGTPITVRDILQHVSGIRDQWTFMTMAGWRMYDDAITRDDVLYFVSRMKTLNFPPREQYLYSNTGYTLAGLIVERLSNQSLADFASSKIFEPLGMKHTVFTHNHWQIVHDRAYGYTGTYPFFELRMPNYDLTGPTNLLTTVEDLVRWDRNFDYKTVGGDDALLPMQTRAVLSDGKTEAPYGFGLMLPPPYRSRKVVEHAGLDAGYRAHLMRFPDQHFAVAILCNVAMPDDTAPHVLARRVADVYLRDEPASATPEHQVPAPSAPPQASGPPPTLPRFAEYTGRYYNDEIDATYEIKLDAPSVAIVRHKYPPKHLDPTVADTFKMTNFSPVVRSGSVHFTRDDQGKINGFLFDGDRIRNFRFTKLP